jgi:hypothetical protein
MREDQIGGEGRLGVDSHKEVLNVSYNKLGRKWVVLCRFLELADGIMVRRRRSLRACHNPKFYI